MHTVYVDFYRAITLAEVSRRIEEAYLRLAGPARRAVAAIARRWHGKAVVTPGGVGGEIEPVAVREQQRLSAMLDLPKLEDPVPSRRGELRLRRLRARHAERAVRRP